MSSIYAFFAGSHSATSALLVDSEIKYVMNLNQGKVERILNDQNHCSDYGLASNHFKITD